MKRAKLLGFIGIITFLLSGCGKVDVEIENVSQAGQQYYYTVEEGIVSAVQKTLDAPEDGIVLTSDPILLGEQIFCTSSVNERDYSGIGFYLQHLENNTQNWRNTSLLDCDFEINDIHYDGFNSFLYPSVDGNMYVEAYILDGENAIARYGTDGIEEIICSIPKEFKETWATREAEKGEGSLNRDKEGNFYSYFKWDNVITCYDATLQKQKTIEVPKYVYGIMQGEAGTDVYWYGTGMDNKPVVGNLTKDKIILEGVEGIATDFEAEIATDGTLYFADTQNVWRVVDGTVQKVFQFTKSGYLISEIYGMEAGEQGELLFLVKLDGEWTLLRMKEIDKPQEKQEVVIAFAMPHLGLNKTIARFNRQSTEYYVTLLLPEEGESEEAFGNRVRMELSAKGGPDILGYDIVTNVSDFVENGYLGCTDAVFADRSKYLEAALEASEIEGKLYGVPYECIFDVVAYGKDSVGERTSWTLEEFMEAVRESDAEILQKNVSGFYIVQKYALYDKTNTMYIDWEQGESHLTEAPFLEVLEFAKEYADTTNIEKEAFAFQTDTIFDRFNCLKQMFSYFEQDACVLGYPRAEGNGIYVEARSLYLNANSECKQGAFAFLEFLVSDQEQQKYITYDVRDQIQEEGLESLRGYSVQLPVLLKAFDALVDLELEKDKDNVVYTDNGKLQLDVLYTDEMIEQLYFMIEHAEPREEDMTVISDLVSEELEAYFMGEISAEEAAQKLDNRVQLYLDER